MTPEELFLSHATPDREFAEGVAHVLRRHGVPVWFSRTDIQGAQQWHDEIGAALARCDWFAVILSPAALASMWVKRELVFALQETRFNDRIVPLMYQECDYRQLSWVLPQLQLVDFTNERSAGYRTLLRRWGIGYREAP